MAAGAGASGLIVPDLPFDADEGLSAACEKRGLVSVPVAAPSMGPARVAALAALNRPLVYAALRAGITGRETAIVITSYSIHYTKLYDLPPRKSRVARRFSYAKNGPFPPWAT